MTKKVPTVVYAAGDVPNKAVTEHPEWVISMLEERGGGVRFHEVSLADMAEVFFTLAVLMHKVSVNKTGRKEVLKLYGLLNGRERDSSRDWSRDEIEEFARLKSSVGALIPCPDPLCRFCKPGGVAPSEN